MKKYGLYSWRVDDDGGWGVCYYHNFNTGLHPFVKCCDWCKPEPSKLICGFDTAEEAANVVYDPDDDYYTKEEIIEEIQSLLDDFLLEQELLAMKKYRVTRKFKPGSLLDGLTHTEITSITFEVGFETEDYIIVSVEEVA